MKKITKRIITPIFFLLIIVCFTAANIFLVEKADLLGLQHIKIAANYAEHDDKIFLQWQPLPYPCMYKIETFAKSTGKVEGEPDFHPLGEVYTTNTEFPLSSPMIPTYYRITAYGIFGRLTGEIQPMPGPNEKTPVSPMTIFKYTHEHPASVMPYLVWHGIPNAVCYEVEILSDKPDQENSTSLSKKNHLFSTQQVFTNGLQVDLRPYANHLSLYWRVRALNIHHQPMGVFSTAEPIVIDKNQPIPNKPLLNNFDQVPNFHQPLYPVYHWIPMHGADHYEVELMAHPPKKENDTEPTPDRVWAFKPQNSFSCYDEYARPYAGPYYWRVRAVDAKGNTIGVYSDTDKFVVEPHDKRILAGAFGDSITHGGGAVSYSPASLEYSYTTYLSFPCVNLGKSGDTAHTSLLRFDADVLPYRPYNLFILTGSNSLRGMVRAEDIIADLEAIRQKCEANDIRPIFLTLMPINPDNIKFAFQTTTDPFWRLKLQKVNAYIRSQKYYIDLEPYFYENNNIYLPTSLATDGLHPDTLGKQLMGEIINQHQDLLRKE